MRDCFRSSNKYYWREISNLDAEMQRTMQTRDFMRLPVERRMEIFNQSREETWQLIKELRSLLAGKESR